MAEELKLDHGRVPVAVSGIVEETKPIMETLPELEEKGEKCLGFSFSVSDFLLVLLMTIPG